MTFARTCTAFLALASAGAFALPAAAEEMMFMAELSGEAEVPPVETEGMGLASATVDTEAMTITWTLAYENLTGEPVAAHLHAPAGPEDVAPPVIDLTTDMDEMEGEASATATATATTTTEEGTETATASDTDTVGENEVPVDILMGSSEITEEQLAALQDGMMYFNVHTPEYPTGEIRGQVMMGEADMEAMEAMEAMRVEEGGTPMESGGMAAEGGDAMEAEGDAMLGGEAIRAAISGNTVQGNMLDSGAYSEFYAADGTIRGEGYTGTWVIEGDAMCFDYGEEVAACWQVRLAGDQITWVQDGADLGDGTIVPGNPNNF